MALVQNPLIGQAKQKLGGTVFQGWKGKNVLRSKPLNVANPQSVGQMLQRMKVTLTTAFYRQISGIVFLGFKSQAIGKTEFNAFASIMLKNAFIGTAADNVVIDPSGILVSKGSIGTQEDVSIDVLNAGNTTATVNYSNGITPVGSSASDKALIVITTSTGEILGSGSNTDRSAGTATISLSRPLDGFETIYALVGFSKADGSNASDSVVVSRVVVL